MKNNISDEIIKIIDEIMEGDRSSEITICDASAHKHLEVEDVLEDCLISAYYIDQTTTGTECGMDGFYGDAYFVDAINGTRYTCKFEGGF